MSLRKLHNLMPLLANELRHLDADTIADLYPGFSLLIKSEEQDWLCNISEKTNLLEFSERNAVEYVIDNMQNTHVFSEVDTPILDLFVRVVNKITRVSNFVNNFSSKSLSQDGIDSFNFFNTIKKSVSLEEFSSRLTLNTHLKKYLPAIFSILKHCQSPVEYPIYYKFWINISSYFFSVTRDYDSFCIYYRTFKANDRHLNFGVFLASIASVFIEKLKSNIQIFSIHSAEYRKVSDVISLSKYCKNVITVDEYLEYAKDLIRKSLKSKDKELDLGNCGIMDLSLLDELFYCIHLTSLTISNQWGVLEQGEISLVHSKNHGKRNCLVHVPDKLSKLRNLKTLICGGDWQNHNREIDSWKLTNLSFLSGLNKLVYLDVSNNKLKDISAISSCKSLQTVRLNNNKISELRSINPLVNLQHLFISNNSISSLPKFHGRSTLNTLDLHSNLIRDITPLKELLKKLEINDSKWRPYQISVGNNPIEIPGKEIVSRGSSSVLSIIEQLETAQEIKLQPYYSTEVKLIVVGNSNAGKSTFIKWLTEKVIDLKIDTTHWLAVSDWKVKKGTHLLSVKIYDFGGQEYYHDTHHIFFSEQTAYVVLWEKATNILDEIEILQRQAGQETSVMIQSFPLKYWLSSIAHYSSNKELRSVESKITDLIDANLSRAEEEISETTTTLDKDRRSKSRNIIVVQNKVDAFSDREYLQQNELAKTFPVFDFASISVKNEHRLNNFESLLNELFSTLPILNATFPGTWGIIRRYLDKNVNALPEEFSLTEFQEYCNRVITEALEEDKFSKQKIRKVLFESQETQTFTQYLNDVGIVLYIPKRGELSDKIFLKPNNIIKSIHAVLSGLQQKRGEFDRLHAAEALDTNLTDPKVKDILSLMNHFKIIFNKPHSDTTFIAPLYLPKEPNEGIKIFLSILYKPVVRFVYKSFIHKAVFLQFFSEFGPLALKDNNNEGYYYWRNGVILKDQMSGEVVLVGFNNTIKTTEGAFVDIHCFNSAIGSLFVSNVIACIERINIEWDCEKLVTADGENFIPISVIKQNEKDKLLQFSYNGKNYNLLDFREYISNTFKMKKIFISYSKADVKDLQKLENHLSVLRRNGDISTWNCRKLLPGDKWDGKIKSEIEEADVVVFLVSDDFLATDYIWDVEIKRAIERDLKDGSVKIIPVIIRSCDWEESPLGVYNTAPRKAQVIGSSNNVDEAWTSVVKEIKSVLSK